MSGVSKFLKNVWIATFGTLLLRCFLCKLALRIQLLKIQTDFSNSKNTHRTGTSNSLQRAMYCLRISLLEFVLSITTQLFARRDYLHTFKQLAGVFSVSLFTRTQVEQNFCQNEDFPEPGPPTKMTHSKGRFFERRCSSPGLPFFITQVSADFSTVLSVILLGCYKGLKMKDKDC